ncbi:MAG: hypothetical protein ACRCR6_11390 [Plesiomonas sp.]
MSEQSINYSVSRAINQNAKNATVVRSDSQFFAATDLVAVVDVVAVDVVLTEKKKISHPQGAVVNDWIDSAGQ